MDRRSLVTVSRPNTSTRVTAVGGYIIDQASSRTTITYNNVTTAKVTAILRVRPPVVFSMAEGHELTTTNMV